MFRMIFEFLKETEEERFVGVFDSMHRCNIHDEVKIIKRPFELLCYSKVDVFCQESCGRVFPRAESAACSTDIARGRGPCVDHMEDGALFANDLTGFEGSAP